VKGDEIEVLSKDSKISGDEGWWTGKCRGKVGVFPCNFVAPCDLDFSNLSKEELKRFYPPHISWSELQVIFLVYSKFKNRYCEILKTLKNAISEKIKPPCLKNKIS
jgi:hypothetical protein